MEDLTEYLSQKQQIEELEKQVAGLIEKYKPIDDVIEKLKCSNESLKGKNKTLRGELAKKQKIIVNQGKDNRIIRLKLSKAVEVIGGIEVKGRKNKAIEYITKKLNGDKTYSLKQIAEKCFLSYSSIRRISSEVGKEIRNRGNDKTNKKG